MRQLKRMRKISLLLCFCAAGLLSGCAIQNLDNVRDESLLYLKEKFPNDNFTWQAYLETDVEYAELRVNSELLPNSDIRVRRYDSDSGVSFTDNYMAYCLEQPCADLVCGVANQTLGECKVFCKINPNLDYSASFGSEATASQMLQSNPMWSIEIDLPPNGAASGQLDPLQVTAFQNSVAAYQWNQITFYVRMLDSLEAYQAKTTFTAGTGKGAGSVSDSCSFRLENGVGDLEWDEKHSF